MPNVRLYGERLDEQGDDSGIVTVFGSIVEKEGSILSTFGMLAIVIDGSSVSWHRHDGTQWESIAELEGLRRMTFLQGNLPLEVVANAVGNVSRITLYASPVSGVQTL